MKSESKEILERLLSDLSRRRKRVRISNGLVDFLLVLSVSLGVVSLLARIHSNNVYFSILKALVVLAACLGFFRLLLAAVLKEEKKTSLAKELDNLSPGLGEDALNAVLLLEETEYEKERGVSKSLIQAHVDSVAVRLKSLDLSRLVPEERIKSHLRPIAFAITLSLILLILAPKGFRSFLLSASIVPSHGPIPLELADIKIKYSYPNYTGAPPKEIVGSTGDVKAIKGTVVRFEATPLSPLDEGNLVIEGGHAIPISVHKGRIEAGFMVISSGAFFIEDKKGRSKSRVFKITSEEDKAPGVVITAPSGDVIDVNEGERLDIHYTAQDDFGLTRLLITWKTKKGESSRNIDQTKETTRSIEGRFQWDPSAIESDPDEIIEVRIKAYDNDTVSGPKLGVSNPIKIRLKNQRKKHEDVLVVLERVLYEFLDILGDEVENGRLKDGYMTGDQNGVGMGTEEKNLGRNIGIIKRTHGIITGKIEKALALLDESLEKMKSDHSSNYTSFLGLSNMKTRIEDLLYERRDLVQTLSPGDLPRLDGLITREINEFEDDILFLDSILKGERLRESLVYGKDALSKYNELSELLEKLKKGDDEETKREIERRVEELRGLMSQLAEKLGSISGDVYEGFLNPDAFESVDLEGKLDKIMDLTEQGKIAEALDLLADIKNGLQGMIASLESGFQSFSSASLSKEITRLNEVIARMKEIENEETSLKKRTEDLKQSLLRATDKREELGDFVERERRKVEELKDSLMEAREEFPSYIPEKEVLEGFLAIERILRNTDELENRLKALDLEEALRSANDIGEGIKRLRNLSKPYGKTEEGDKGGMRRSEEIAKEVYEDLKRLLRGETREGQSHRIVERQEEIEKETGEIVKYIEENKGDLPLQPSVGERLDESIGFMRGASRNLKGKEVSKAISNQEEAIRSLRKAREETEGLLEKYRLSAKGMGPSVPFVLGGDQPRQGPRGIDTGYVEIPPPQESESGKEFKESLLKALREGSPEGYSELNKRYYERIVK